MNSMICFKREPGSINILTRQHEKDDWNEIRELDIFSWVNSVVIGFTDDNAGLYVLDGKDSDTNNLLILDVQDGSVKENMAHDAEYDLGIMTHINEPGPVVIRDDSSGKIQAILCNKDKPGWIFFDDEIERDFQVITDHLGQGVIELISSDVNKNKWIISFYSDVKALQWYLFDRKTKELELVFADRQVEESDKFCPMEPINFQARDGVTVHGYITYPDVDKLEQLPMVLLVHGGPHSL